MSHRGASPATRRQRNAALVRSLSDQEVAKVSTVLALFILRNELDPVDDRPTYAPCGHERVDVCTPFFGKRLLPRVDELVKNLGRVVPFPSLSANLDGCEVDIFKGSVRGIPKAHLSTWVSVLDQALGSIPTRPEDQIYRLQLVHTCPDVEKNSREDVARVLRMKSALEILNARLRALGTGAPGAPFVQQDRYQHAWETLLETEFPKYHSP